MCVYIYPVDIIPKHTQFDWRVPVHYCFQSHVRIQVRGEYVMGGYIDWGANLWILLSTRLCMCGMKVSVYVLNVYVYAYVGVQVYTCEKGAEGEHMCSV